MFTCIRTSQISPMCLFPQFPGKNLFFCLKRVQISLIIRNFLKKYSAKSYMFNSIFWEIQQSYCYKILLHLLYKSQQLVYLTFILDIVLACIQEYHASWYHKLTLILWLLSLSPSSQNHLQVKASNKLSQFYFGKTLISYISSPDIKQDDSWGKRKWEAVKWIQVHSS